MTIPKIIHQIWFQGKETIPLHLIEYQNSWKTLNPNYKYMFWDDNSINQFIQNINLDWIKETYNNFSLLIQKIDFAKYVILYFMGGIYIDMDMKCIKPLDTLLELPNIRDKKIILSSLTYDFAQRFVFLLSGHYDIHNLVNNGIIICEEKHDILFKTLTNCYKNKNNFFKNKSNFLYIFYSTGPLVLSNALIEYTSNQNENTKTDEIEILDQSYFEGCDLGKIKNKKCTIPPNAIGIHYYEASWASNNERHVVNMYYFLKNNFILIMIFFVLVYYLYK